MPASAAPLPPAVRNTTPRSRARAALCLGPILGLVSACVESQRGSGIFDPGPESNVATSSAALCRPPSWPPAAPVPETTGPVETVPPEPAKPFAIAVNGEDSGYFRCGDVKQPNCAGQFVYYEGARSYFLSERPEVIDDHRPHRHPTEMVSPCGLPASSATGCAPEVPTGSQPRGLLFEGYSQADRVDRIELNVSQSGGGPEEILQFGEWRYLRFFFKLNPGFSLSTTTTTIPAEPPCPAQTLTFAQTILMMQVWQRDSSSYQAGTQTRKSVGPAFGIQLTNDIDPTRTSDRPPPAGSTFAQFVYRNDAISEDEVSGNPIGASCIYYGACKQFWSDTVPIDRWVGYVIAMKPAYIPNTSNPITDPPARGSIMVWRIEPDRLNTFGAPLDVTTARNYNSGNDSSYRFYWGFRPEVNFLPSSTPGYAGGFTNRFDVRIGQYRDSHSWSPMLFDAVKLTNHEGCLPGTTEKVGPCGP